jgi:hypothetical protein
MAFRDEEKIVTQKDVAERAGVSRGIVCAASLAAAKTISGSRSRVDCAAH